MSDKQISVNPKISGVYVFDLDSDYAIKFGDKWLPKNTTIGARKYPDGRIEKTISKSNLSTTR